MDLAYSLSKLQNVKVCIHTIKENYIGNISEVNLQNFEVGLTDVLQLSKKEKIVFQLIKIADIISYKPIENESSNKAKEKQYNFFLPPRYADILSNDFKIISSTDHDDFNNAIHHLKRQDIIGISFEANEMERNSTLLWLSASTPDCTYLFDISKLGSNGFTQGLKTVLEDSLIQKLVHDCRRPSNCLFHQYNTKLANVYDTQVADFLINAQKSPKEKISRNVNSLVHCLKVYLHLSDEYLPQQFRLCNSGSQITSHHLKDYLLKNVVYLRLLKTEMDLILRMPFRRCVDIFLQSVLRKSDQDLKLNPPETELLPAELLLENIEVLKISEEMLNFNYLSTLGQSKIKNPYAKYFNDCKKYQTQRLSQGKYKFESMQQQLSYADANALNKCEMVLYLISKMFDYDEVKSISSKISRLEEDDILSITTQDTVYNGASSETKSTVISKSSSNKSKEPRSNSSVLSVINSPLIKLKNMLDKQALNKDGENIGCEDKIQHNDINYSKKYVSKETDQRDDLSVSSAATSNSQLKLKIMINNHIIKKEINKSDESGYKSTVQHSGFTEDLSKETGDLSNQSVEKSAIISPQSKLRNILNILKREKDQSNDSSCESEVRQNDSTSNYYISTQKVLSTSCSLKDSSSKHEQLLNNINSCKSDINTISQVPKAFDLSSEIKLQEISKTNSSKSSTLSDKKIKIPCISQHKLSSNMNSSSYNNSSENKNLKVLSVDTSYETLSTNSKNLFGFKKIDSMFHSLAAVQNSPNEISKENSDEWSSDEEACEKELSQLSSLVKSSQKTAVSAEEEIKIPRISHYELPSNMNSSSHNFSVDKNLRNRSEDTILSTNSKNQFDLKQIDSVFHSLAHDNSPNGISKDDSGEWSSDDETCEKDLPELPTLVKSSQEASLSAEEDPWSKLRDSFSNCGPTKHAGKLVFVPAGMQF